MYQIYTGSSFYIYEWNILLWWVVEGGEAEIAASNKVTIVLAWRQDIHACHFTTTTPRMFSCFPHQHCIYRPESCKPTPWMMDPGGAGRSLILDSEKNCIILLRITSSLPFYSWNHLISSPTRWYNSPKLTIVRFDESKRDLYKKEKKKNNSNQLIL